MFDLPAEYAIVAATIAPDRPEVLSLVLTGGNLDPVTPGEPAPELEAIYEAVERRAGRLVRLEYFDGRRILAARD